MRSIYSTYKNSVLKALVLALAVCFTGIAKAQLNPLASQYFQNQYLFNPAMAGIKEGLNLNLDYSKQGVGVDGAESMQAVSADWQLDKVGLGVNVMNQYSGLFRTTRAVVTYAYHLPIGANNQKLNFGLSGGFVNQHLQTGDVIGDQSDISIANFNNKQNYVDGDFGVSYTSDKLTVQGALPNLKTLFKDNQTPEREVFFTAVSYKLFDPTDVSFEPKVAFRKVKGFNDIVDAGAELGFNNNAFSIQGMYHSSNSASAGFSFNQTAYAIAAFYTTNTSQLNAYNNGAFEISLKFNFLNNK
jgi:type IX secretion system PorP/SprF family membrane protein